MIHISKGNTKIGLIPSVSTPAGLTCRNDCDCAKGCYAKKGTFLYKNVGKAALENYQEYKRDSQNFFNEINAFLNGGELIYKFFRWSVSGDLVDYKYFLGIVETAKNNKATKFLVFTKKFDLVNMYLTLGHKLPSNLKVIFSHWNKAFEDKIENPFNLPSAYVDFRKKSQNANFSRYAFECPGNCKACGHHCWNIKNGQQVVFHQH